MNQDALIPNRTLESLKLGCMQIVRGYDLIIKDIKDYIKFFEKRQAVRVIPFDLFKARNIIRDLKQQVHKFETLRTRFINYYMVVNVDVSLDYFKKPLPKQVLVPAGVRPMTRRDIDLAIQHFVRLMLGLELVPFYLMP